CSICRGTPRSASCDRWSKARNSYGNEEGGMPGWMDSHQHAASDRVSYRPMVSTSAGRKGTRACSPGISGGSMMHALGIHFDPSASSLKFELTVNGPVRYVGSSTWVRTTSHWV